MIWNDRNRCGDSWEAAEIHFKASLRVNTPGKHKELLLSWPFLCDLMEKRQFTHLIEVTACWEISESLIKR